MEINRNCQHIADAETAIDDVCDAIAHAIMVEVVHNRKAIMIGEITKDDAEKVVMNYFIDYLSNAALRTLEASIPRLDAAFKRAVKADAMKDQSK